MKSCKKCMSSAMSVHILSSGFCQECQEELSWKNADREITRQKGIGQRVKMYEQGKEYIKRKWKDKYGDDEVDTVLGYR